MLIPVHEQPRPGEYIRFNRRISKGDSLYVMDATPSELLEVDRCLVEQARQRAGVEQDDLAAILVFSCVGRYRSMRPIRFLEGRCPDNVPGFRQGSADRRRVLGRVRRGRVAGGAGLQSWRFVCSLARVAARYSRAADLQTKLLEWADRLAACKTPRQVMETALRGAVEAGARGGQFCIVDYAIGRILGKGHGYAFSHPESGQDWQLALTLTNREVPSDIGGPFPGYLRDWSLPVRHGVNLSWSDSPVLNEDLLTLIVRALQALYVPDPFDGRFQCRQEVARKARIREFLAIPLVGSAGKAIATLQLSFPNGYLPDREEFRLWVGYGQKVGAALERTQEAEERNITSQISAFANKLLQDAPSLKDGSYSWCDSFLSKTVELLGTQDGHIRVLQPNDQDKERREEYLLVGSVEC